MATTTPPKTGPAARWDAEYAALHPNASAANSDPTKLTASSSNGSSSSSAALSVNIEAPDLTGLSRVADSIDTAESGINNFKANLKKIFTPPNLIDFFGGAVGIWIVLAALVLLAMETDAGQTVAKTAVKAATKGVV